MRLSCGDLDLWSIDVSWLAGDPRLDVVHEGDSISIALRGTRYPGTDISADFVAEILDGNDAPLLRLSHSLAGEFAEVPLLQWLAAEQALSFTEKATDFSAAVGQFLTVTQDGPAAVSISPTLALRATSAQGWQVSGSEFSGHASSVTLSHPIEPQLIVAEGTLLSSHLSIDTFAGAGVRMHPRMSARPHCAIGDSTIATIRLELAETEHGIRHSAFLSQGIGVALVTDQAAVGAQHSRLLARDPMYGRVVGAAGEGHAKWSALQGRSITPFGNHMVVSEPVADGQSIDIESRDGACTIDCAAYPHSVAIASDSEVGITVRFPDAHADVAASAMPSICPFSFSSKELSLDGAEVVFRRPSNALLLKFRFDRFKLRRTWRGLRLIASRDCRLHLLTGAQSVIEQTFLEEPAKEMEPTTGRADEYENWLGELYDRSGAKPTGRQAFIDQRLSEYLRSVDRGHTEKLELPSKARVSGESQLVYRIRDALDAEATKLLFNLSLKLDHLLDERLWELVVVRDALSSERVRKCKGTGYPIQADKNQPPADATFFEMPGSLFISPNEEGRLLPMGLNGDASSSYRDIFRLVADTSATPAGMPLRAIGAKGFTAAASILPRHFDPSAPQDPDPIGFRTPLDMRDRVEFVWLTSQWGFSAIYGTRDVRVPLADETACSSKPISEIEDGSTGIYVPRPFHANTLTLSSLGGSMKSLGTWDPPSLNERFALSVERWEHSSTFARAHHDEVVYKGFLLPTGHRVALIKVTQREERRDPETGVVSVPIQRFFIELTNPEAEYSEFLAPQKGRTWPFRHIKLLLTKRLQIDDPTRSDICKLGQSAFKVCVGGHGYPFQFEIDREPARRGAACMVFIDNTVAHSQSDMQNVVDAFNGLGPASWNVDGPDVCAFPASGITNYSMQLLGSKVHYAPSRKKDDTCYVTQAMFVRLGLHEDLINSAIIEASGKPPTYPEMDVSDVVISALNRLTDKPGDYVTRVKFAELFTVVGFDDTESASAKANTSEVFLSLLKPVQMSFTGRGERSGAVGTPNSEVHHLSRSIGLMGKTDQPLAPPVGSGALLAKRELNSTVKFNAAELFNPDAKLLGVIPMSALFEAMGLNEIPTFVESIRHQIDAVGDQIQTGLCSFATSASAQLKDWSDDERFAELLAESSALEPFKSGHADLVAAIDDLRKSVCGPSQFALDSATVAVGKAGQALDKMRECIDNVVQNPALLLPATVTDLIAKWKDLVDRLRKQYSDLLNVAKTIEADARQAVQAAVDGVKEQVGNNIADRLNHVCSELIHRAKQFAEQHLPTDQQLQPFVTFYGNYYEIFLDVLGWYEELEKYESECVTKLMAVWDACIAEFQRAGSTLHQARDRVRSKLEDLDQRSRNWPTVVFEECRSFFRRVEPTVSAFGVTLRQLLDIQVQSAHKVPSLIEDLRLSLADLRTVAGQIQKSDVTQDFWDYLIAIKLGIDAVVDELVGIAFDLKALTVAIQGIPSTVGQSIEQLEKDLRALGARAVPQSLKAAVDVWNGAPGTPEKADVAVRAFVGLASICVIVHVSGNVRALSLTTPPRVKSLTTFLRALIDDKTKGLSRLVIAWIDEVAPGAAGPPPWLELVAKYQHLLPKNMVRDFDALVASMRATRTILQQWKSGDLFSSDAFRNIATAVARMGEDWARIVAALQRMTEAPDRALLEALRNEVIALASGLVPSEIRLDFNFKTDLEKTVAIFKPGIDDFSSSDPNAKSEKAELSLTAEIVTNPIRGSSTSDFRGSLKWFRIDLFGFLIIKFDVVRFEALSGSGPRLLPPEGVDAELSGCLAFVNKLKEYFGGKSGPYVMPLPNGIRAGYRFSPGMITIGAMIIQDLVLDAGIEVPFDDRAAVITLAVSSRKEPALLFIAPYGGAMFFGIKMAGDRLVDVEASFEAGLVAAFNLTAVKGTGRVTMGFYYRQSGTGIALDGFFFAGGAATILSIVSMSVSLRIGLHSSGENVAGYGEFSVEIGCSPFEWTLSYSVERNVPGGGNSRLSRTGRAALAAASTDDRVDPHEVFTDPTKWAQFQSAFVKA